MQAGRHPGFVVMSQMYQYALCGRASNRLLGSESECLRRPRGGRRRWCLYRPPLLSWDEWRSFRSHPLSGNAVQLPKRRRRCTIWCERHHYARPYLRARLWLHGHAVRPSTLSQLRPPQTQSLLCSHANTTFDHKAYCPATHNVQAQTGTAAILERRAIEILCPRTYCQHDHNGA